MLLAIGANELGFHFGSVPGAGRFNELPFFLGLASGPVRLFFKPYQKLIILHEHFHHFNLMMEFLYDSSGHDHDILSSLIRDNKFLLDRDFKSLLLFESLLDVNLKNN